MYLDGFETKTGFQNQGTRKSSKISTCRFFDDFGKINEQLIYFDGYTMTLSISDVSNICSYFTGTNNLKRRGVQSEFSSNFSYLHNIQKINEDEEGMFRAIVLIDCFHIYQMFACSGLVLIKCLPICQSLADLWSVFGCNILSSQLPAY